MRCNRAFWNAEAGFGDNGRSSVMTDSSATVPGVFMSMCKSGPRHEDGGDAVSDRREKRLDVGGIM
ncbi:hypothetical protein AA12467_1676 [Gluconobacter sphaericus NBRC 12467]|nr:hypothetical protein AA12467_1676 [Gluconobacter sphaericus NBRC 12467]